MRYILKLEVAGYGDELGVEDKIEVMEDKFLVSGMSHWVESDTIHQNGQKWGDKSGKKE